VWRLRPPNGLESQQLGPAWFAVCAAARVDPNRYRIWIHEGPEATAPATAGSTVAVTSWAALVLPRRNLEADLAHELAHRLALPRPVSLIVYGLSMPARVMGKAIAAGWKQPIVGFVIKFIVGFLLIGVLGVLLFWGFGYYIVFMLSPLAAPFVVQWASRASERYADRVALDLGYGPALAEVFTGREYERAQSWSTAPRQGLKDSQPLDSARLRALERLLASAPESNHQPR
jgi:Zn-dependent protease with chaperone function